MAERTVRNVHVHLTTQITQDDKTDRYTIDEDGQAVKIGDKFYIRYHESKRDNAKVTLKINNDHIMIKRKPGEEFPSSQMEFSSVEDQHFSYPTRWGNIEMLSQTNMMDVQLDEKPLSGRVNLDYSLHSGNNLVGNYKLRLIFK